MKDTRPPDESVSFVERRQNGAETGNFRGWRSWDPIVVAILASACVYVAWLVDRGWIPHDDGLLAQAAERILLGQRPHIDFQDPYTGGLTYWHALALRLFGVHLLSLRVVLFLSHLPFLAATFVLLRRFLQPRWAALAAAGAVVWGLPNYPASMPTWYNLFLAVAALLAFFRFLESGRHGWLMWAGAATGVSALFKLVGVFSLAGLLLALFFSSSWVGRPSGGVPRRSRWAAVLASSGAVVYAVLLTRLVLSGEVTEAHLFHYLLPGIVVGMGVVGASWLGPVGGDGPPTGGGLLWRRTLALVTGFAIPIVLFAVPYGVSGTLADLWHGVVVLPQRRFAFASGAPFPLRRLLPSLPLFLVAGVAVWGPQRWRGRVLWVLMAFLGSILVLGSLDAVFGTAWYGLRALPTLLVVSGLVAVAVRLRDVGDGSVPDALVLMAASVFAMLGTFSMVQFPFTGPVYFFYVAPLLPLAGAALFTLTVAPSTRRLMAAVLTFGTLFGVTWVNHASLLGLGAGRFEARAEERRLAVERGRIRVSSQDKAVYEELVTTVQAVTRSPSIYVTPDAPEVYFLSGLRNPTPVFYDFFAEQEGRTSRILQILDREDVNVVVLNTALTFSPPPPPQLIEALEARYGSARMVGPFIVRWY
jgi:hypothetical protein